MSDYNNPNSYDKYGNPIPGPLGTDPARPYAYEPAEGSGRAPYILVGLLALIAIIGGAMYFTPHRTGDANVAQAPAAATDTRPAPTTPPAAPMSTTPAPTTTTPAPAPSSMDQK